MDRAHRFIYWPHDPIEKNRSMFDQTSSISNSGEGIPSPNGFEA